MIIKELIRTRYPAQSFTEMRELALSYSPAKPPARIQTASVTFGDPQFKAKVTFKKMKTLEAMRKFKAESIQLRADIYRARAERKAGL